MIACRYHSVLGIICLAEPGPNHRPDRLSPSLPGRFIVYLTTQHFGLVLMGQCGIIQL